MKPACVDCQVELRVVHNGAVIVEQSARGPLAVWRADVWLCPDCEHQSVIGYSLKPFASEADADFGEQLRSLRVEAGEGEIILFDVWPNRREKAVASCGNASS